MKNISLLSIKLKHFIFSILILYSCDKAPEISTIETLALIPYPNEILSTNMALDISSISGIAGDDKTLNVYEIIKKEWEDLKAEETKNKSWYLKKRSIHLNIENNNDSSSKEAYSLEIKRDGIIIKSSDSEGIYRGWQSLSQIIKLRKNTSNPNYIPTGLIIDNPEYEYRGTMLDVSRHFFDLTEVKRHIDLISNYKINYLHLHLSDDQGWRIEIKSWPKLTIIGSKTEVGGGIGGFYSQEDYIDIVNYAASKFITIVPEIDIPGHTNSALASYSNLNCDGKLRELYTGTRVGFSTLCNNEYAFKFLDDVIREISAITPGPYFHIGGDESYVTSRSDYLEFISKATKIVRKYDKTVIGWDDINAGDIPENSVLQLWNVTQQEQSSTTDGDYQNKALTNVLNGLKKGSKVLISPAALVYLDMKYDSLTKLGLNWAGYIDVKKGYDWKIEESFPELPKDKIIGIEAPLWSETITNSNEIDFLAFPRLTGYAEIGWTKANNRNWQSYKERLAKHSRLWKQSKVNYYASPLINWAIEKEID